MRNRMLRSVLVAIFSTVVAFGALGGASSAQGDVRADTSWPAVAETTVLAKDTNWPVPPVDSGARS